MQGPGEFERYLQRMPTLKYLRKDMEPLLCDFKWHIFKQNEDVDPMMSDAFLGLSLFLFLSFF